jgi:hypothetical protein
MKKIHPYKLLPLLILVPPIFASCLCIAYLGPRAIGFFTSSSYPDYLWSVRITRALSNLGYPVHDVTVYGDELPGGRRILVQIGNLKGDERQRSFDVVKAVHTVIFETFKGSSSPPNPVDYVDIMLIDYSDGTYDVGIDFETIQKYQEGEISEEIYFQHWSYSEGVPEITPP